MNQPIPEIVRQVIHGRRTAKVLGNPADPVHYPADVLNRCDEVVKQAIRDCGRAPFHYDRRQDQIAEPWRVYWIDCDSCRRLAVALPELIPDLKPGNKMPALLAGCGSLTLFTWLPQAPAADAPAGEPGAAHSGPRQLDRVNREHLAATAAAVQNFLLLLTAADIPSYWASGTLIADHLFGTLGISESESLIGAVFTHYPGGRGHTEVIGGKQRDRRSPDQAWFRELSWQP